MIENISHRNKATNKNNNKKNPMVAAICINYVVEMKKNVCLQTAEEFRKRSSKKGN